MVEQFWQEIPLEAIALREETYIGFVFFGPVSNSSFFSNAFIFFVRSAFYLAIWTFTSYFNQPTERIEINMIIGIITNDFAKVPIVMV